MGLAAITYDSPEILNAFAAEQGIRVPLLSDEGSQVISRYGILNREVDPTRRTYGIPYPGTFILDADGRVTSRFFEPRYQDRFTVSSIAVKLGDPIAGVERNGTRLTTDHLEVLAYATDDTLAPGNRFTMALDVTPKTGMHVYAPGDHSYRVIKLNIEPQDILQIHPVSYPESQEYYFEPLDERVQVYERPFRLTQDVTVVANQDTAKLAATPNGTFMVAGVIEYQACDDKVCYDPVELPISWTFTWKPLLRS